MNASAFVIGAVLYYKGTNEALGSCGNVTAKVQVIRLNSPGTPFAGDVKILEVLEQGPCGDFEPGQVIKNVCTADLSEHAPR